MVSVSEPARIEFPGALSDDRPRNRQHLGIEGTLGFGELWDPNLVGGEQLATASPAVAAAVETAAEAQKPARRPLPDDLPREDLRHPAPCTCPGCGGALRKLGDEVTETLDYVPGRFKVIRHIREKLSCRACDMVVAASAPDHAIARGRAGRGCSRISSSRNMTTTCRSIDPDATEMPLLQRADPQNPQNSRLLTQ